MGLLGSAQGEACILGGEAAFQWWNHSCWFLLSPEMLNAHRLWSYTARLRELCNGQAKLLPFNDCGPRSRSRSSCLPPLDVAPIITEVSTLPETPARITPPRC